MRELAGRVRRVGAGGQLTIRADSGFWSAKVIGACRDHDIRFSITVRQTQPIRAAIATILEGAWTPIDDTLGGIAEVAETTYQGMRLVVRRTRLIRAQGELVFDWRHHAFATDRAGDAVALAHNLVAGSPTSASASTDRLSPPRSAGTSSRCRGESPAQAGGECCTCRAPGPGRNHLRAPSGACGR